MWWSKKKIGRSENVVRKMTASQITTAQAETKTPEIKLTSFGDWSGIKSIRVVTTPRFSFFDKSTASDSH